MGLPVYNRGMNGRPREASQQQAIILSEDEETKQFVNIVCKDTDLLNISVIIQKSVRDVCIRLGLGEASTKEIENQDYDNAYKIYRALIAWSEKDDSRLCTWGELMECLSTFDDPGVLECVKDYLRDCQPRERGECFFDYKNVDIHFLHIHFLIYFSDGQGQLSLCSKSLL